MLYCKESAASKRIKSKDKRDRRDFLWTMGQNGEMPLLTIPEKQHQDCQTLSGLAIAVTLNRVKLMGWVNVIFSAGTTIYAEMALTIASYLTKGMSRLTSRLFHCSVNLRRR
jgi:hypothetical protein